MKKKYLVLIVLFVTVIGIPYYVQAQEADVFRQEGVASWYGKEFEGRPTASGEIFDSSQLTAAHPSLPFGTMLVVTNQHNNKKVTVRINDRGPFVAARIIDVSRAAAEQLDMIITGTAPVLIQSIDKTEKIASPSAQPVTDNSAAVYVSQPYVTQYSSQVRLTPEIKIIANKTYKLQVGSYKVAKNAVDAFEKLKNSGLNPAYERYSDSENSEYFRVILAGVLGSDVQSTTERIGAAGFKEAVIREEKQ